MKKYYGIWAIIFASWLICFYLFYVFGATQSKSEFRIGYEVPMLTAANATNIVLAKQGIEETLTYMEVTNAENPVFRFKDASYTEWRQKVSLLQIWMNRYILSAHTSELTPQEENNLIHTKMVEFGLIYLDGGDKVPVLIYPSRAWIWIW